MLCQGLMRVARFRHAAGNANSRRRVPVVAHDRDGLRGE